MNGFASFSPSPYLCAPHGLDVTLLMVPPRQVSQLWSSGALPVLDLLQELCGCLRKCTLLFRDGVLPPSLPPLPQTNFAGVSPEHMAWLLVYDPQDLQDQMLFVTVGRWLLVQENCLENSPSCHCHLLGDGWEKRRIFFSYLLGHGSHGPAMEEDHRAEAALSSEMLVIMAAVWKNIKKR